MTDDIKKQIQILRESGLGYKAIAKKLSISENTVKSFCRRNNVNSKCALHKADEDKSVCMFCGSAIEQIKGRKIKKFCTDKCRNKWWNSHLILVNRKANYILRCAYCLSEFTVYGNKNRKYCSHECYVKSRFGGENNEIRPV